MPFAKRRATEELNRAYAHVTGVGFHAAANKLKDTLVAMGFDEAVVRRVAGLVRRSEYKRRQAPPGPKVTPRAFGRERRHPITAVYGEL